MKMYVILSATYTLLSFIFFSISLKTTLVGLSRTSGGSISVGCRVVGDGARKQGQKAGAK